MELAISYPPVQRLVFLSPHGLASAGGFLLGAMLLLRELRRRDFDTRIAERALTWAAIGAIVGARLDYVVSQPQAFLDDPARIVRVWEGGLALFGGFIGGVLAALPVLRAGRVHLWRFLDAAAPGFALGVVVGRIGDLAIADHLGDLVRSDLLRPIGFTIREGYELAPGFAPSPAVPGNCELTGNFYAGCTYHMPALYDLVGALALLGVLLWVRRRGRARAGVTILLFGAWYGAQRFVVDFTRSTVDEHIPVVNLTGTQTLGILLSVASAATLVVIARRGRGLGEEPGDPPSREGSLYVVGAGPVDDAEPFDGEPGDGGEPVDDGGPVVDGPGGGQPVEAGGSDDSDASSTPSANPRA